MRQSLLLLGRSGSGKTSVMETLCGSEVKNTRDVQSFTRFGLEIKAMETFGLFSGEHNRQACTQDIEDFVKSSPGIDVIGFVIRIGRFTPEEKEMIDIFLDVLGEGALNFTIVIFTHLDNLIYDDVLLSEFLQDSPQELQNLLSVCDGRYVGFDNTGSTAEKQGYARALIEAMASLQKKNKSAQYTVDMFEQARNAKLVKDQEQKRVEEENSRQLKEQMKQDIRKEIDAKVRREFNKLYNRNIEATRYSNDYERSQERKKLEDEMFARDQGRQNPEDEMLAGDQGRRNLEDDSCADDYGGDKIEDSLFANGRRRTTEEVRYSTDDGRRKLEDERYAGAHGSGTVVDMDKDGKCYEASPGVECALKIENKTSKPRDQKPMVKPKPAHLKIRGKQKKNKRAESREGTSENSSTNHSTSRRPGFVGRLIQLWNSLTGH